MTLRMNLKELRDLLNKIPEKYLEEAAVTHMLGTETQEEKFGIVVREEGSDAMQLFDTKEYSEIQERFINFLNKDLDTLSGLTEEEKDDFDGEVDW